MSDEPTNFLPGFPPAPKRGETKVIDRGLAIHPAVQQIIDAGPWGDGNIAVAADTFRRWATRIASWSFQLGQKQGDRLATSASKDSGEWNAAIVAAVKVCHDKVLDRENPFDNGCWSCAVAVSSLTRDVNVGQTGTAKGKSDVR